MKVVVGLSGGVDSSVTAQLLVEAGHEVLGIYMRNWSSQDENCPTTQDSLDAMKVAQKIGIPFEIVDFSQRYWDDVFAYFLSENKAGRTPNPDILCNKHIKFRAFLDYALEQGAEALATGHYARKKINTDTGLAELALPVDENKDQTYFLHQLSQEQLVKAMFPLADYTKAEVRKIAEKNGFITANKKDSTGICFIGERHYASFLQKYMKKEPGEILDFETNKKVAQHQGLSFYTIGQSKGVGIGGQREFPEGKWYVHSKDLERNILYVTQDENLLMGSELTAHNLNWIAGKLPAKEFKAQAKIRYRDEGANCTVTVVGSDTIKVIFDEPARAITSGQSVVLYLDDVCLGGGEII
jgi:tRNA-specific 2-thiouridylase